MKGVGEIFIRSLTSEIHPEKIAKDLDGMMKVVSKHGVPIQFPTAWSQFPGGLFYGDPLWVDEVAMRHPNVPIILTKMGRSIGRYFDSAMTVAMRNVNIYFDVVGTNPQHLRFAIDKIGAHRIMFGTDWSATWRWISVPMALHKLRLKVLDDANLTEEERRMILWDNAVKIFKLEKEAERARGVFSKGRRIGRPGARNGDEHDELAMAFGSGRQFQSPARCSGVMLCEPARTPLMRRPAIIRHARSRLSYRSRPAGQRTILRAASSTGSLLLSVTPS